MQLLGKILGDPNKRELKLIQPIIDKINALEPDIKALSDEDLSAKTGEFRAQLALRYKGGRILEDVFLKLFREALEQVEPLAHKLHSDQLRAAISAYRQKVERNNREDALTTHLQDTLSECFETGYEKISPLLNELRISVAMDHAEEHQEWPDEAKDPEKATLTLLKVAEPALKDIEQDLLQEAFEPAWEKFSEQNKASTGEDEDHTEDRHFEMLLRTILRTLQPEITALKAEEMDKLTPDMVKRYRDGKTLKDLLPEAFAVVREAGRRTLNMRHYDVQLVGGVVLHQGKIAEMRTGEGKTLVETLPIYLNALTGRGVHLVTVNDYLARRDAEWMQPIYNLLGMTVGILINSVNPQSNERRTIYQADITYGTNNEFGFDYLRDNMVTSLDQMVQREPHFAIVDEVDNILIDEARTPLIISGQGEESTGHYVKFARWSAQLKPKEHDDDDDASGDYTVEEKTRAVILTENGIDKIERLAGIQNIYDEENIDLTRYMENAIKAQVIYKRDKDYIVKDGEVIIVDEFTGRLMAGRRYSEGLHQAIEAKEGVKVQRENHTLATVTFQNYFRLYEKLAGMTGTALTEAEEFHKIYTLDVVVIPTNKSIARKDFSDLIYRNQKAKWRAVVEEIKEMNEAGRPVLVGTTSVETSEMLARELEREGIEHSVLNAKHHEREAQIVAQAGQSKAVTIATNMAGRGTDIQLGGNPAGYLDSILRKHAEQVEYIRAIPTQSPEERKEKEEAIEEYISRMTEDEKSELLAAKVKERRIDHDLVVESGGLHIIGTERHESRRIDNQLRGRAGRQGDPGSSRFFLALDDELMRRFAADRVAGLMARVGMDEETPLESNLVSRFIENAQRQVEGYNFDTRKHVVEYDDVIAKQREVIYTDRRAVIEHGDMHERVLQMIRNEVARIIETSIPGPMITEEEQLETIYQTLEKWVHIPEEMVPDNVHSVRRDDIKEELTDLILEHYQKRGEELQAQVESQGARKFEPLREFERTYMLQVVDRLWMDHIDSLDVMRAGIGFRSVGQRDPLVEFKNEAYRMFEQLKIAIQHYTVDSLLKMMRNEVKLTVQRPEPQRKMPRNVRTNVAELAAVSGQTKTDASETARSSSAARKNTTAARNGKSGATAPTAPTLAKVGRNDPCPCGSGKKYKKCHGS